MHAPWLEATLKLNNLSKSAQMGNRVVVISMDPSQDLCVIWDVCKGSIVEFAWFLFHCIVHLSVRVRLEKWSYFQPSWIRASQISHNLGPTMCFLPKPPQKTKNKQNTHTHTPSPPHTHPGPPPPPHTHKHTKTKTKRQNFPPTAKISLHGSFPNSYFSHFARFASEVGPKSICILCP